MKSYYFSIPVVLACFWSIRKIGEWQIDVHFLCFKILPLIAFDKQKIKERNNNCVTNKIIEI